MTRVVGNAVQQPWLTALLVLWALLLTGGFVWRQIAHRSRIPRPACLLSSAVLVAAAWTWYSACLGTPTARSAGALATGMTLGLVGDVLMAGVMGHRYSMPGGIAAFGLGHFAYIVAGLGLGNVLGLSPEARFGCWGAALVVGAVGWYVVVYREGPTPPSLPRAKGGQLRWAALPYALLLASTLGIASGLALRHASLWPFALGAALFLVSDLLIAARLFARRSFRAIDDVIWLTYGPGQMLIVYSAGAALQQLA